VEGRAVRDVERRRVEAWSLAQQDLVGPRDAEARGDRVRFGLGPRVGEQDGEDRDAGLAGDPAGLGEREQRRVRRGARAQIDGDQEIGQSAMLLSWGRPEVAPRVVFASRYARSHARSHGDVTACVD
jgi:hypothetical protein